MTKPTNRRRWFRFSLRMLLVVVTVLCVWLAIKVNAARRQKEAVTAILGSGGFMYFDYQMKPLPGKPEDFTVNPNALPPGPAWLRKLLGDDFFGNVVYVAFERRNISERTLAQLSKLPNLRTLSVGISKIVPDGSGNPRFIQDNDLEWVGQLSQLRSLTLNNCDINGSGISNLANLKHLTFLGLAITKIDDVAMEHIGTFGTLEYLGLGYTRITDAGLKHLQRLSNLEQLVLRSTSISDAGLKYLEGLTKLKLLDLTLTRVTRNGVRELQNSLPTTKIDFP